MNINTQIKVQEIQIQDALEWIDEIDEAFELLDVTSEPEEWNELYEAKEKAYNMLEVSRQVKATLEAQKEAE